MIIVCPECETRYQVKADIRPAQGLMMRCTQCAHEWFYKEAGFEDVLNETQRSDDFEDRLKDIEQALEEDEKEEDETLTIDFSEREDNPVKPNVKAPPKKETKPRKPQKKAKKKKGGHFMGAFIGLLAFMGVFIVGLVFQERVIAHLPVSKPLYTALGFKIPVVGEGLVFDRVETQWDDSKFKIEGQILNLLAQDSAIPEIELLFQSAEGEILDKALFSVKDSHIQKEDSLAFHYEIQVMGDVKANTSSVKLSFLPVE